MDTAEFDPSRLGLEASPRLVVELSDEAETRRLGAALGAVLETGAFVGLVGALGAGKTTLVQSLVTALDADAQATSPTYTLLNEYATEPPVVHVDLYRLGGYDELESIGYWDYVESGRAITCVEWLDRVPDAWPRHGILIALERADGGRRARLWASPEYDEVFGALTDRVG